MYAVIGAATRKRREELGMTQATLASLVGLSRTSITNIESGRQPMLVHQLVHMCGVLGIGIGTVLAGVTVSDEQAAKQNEVPPLFLELLAKLKPDKDGGS